MANKFSKNTISFIFGHTIGQKVLYTYQIHTFSSIQVLSHFLGKLSYSFYFFAIALEVSHNNTEYNVRVSFFSKGEKQLKNDDIMEILSF